MLDMLEETFVVGPVQMNSRLVVCAHTGHAAVIDPGDEAERILKAIKEIKTPNGKSVEVKYLLLTHAHFDHISAARKLREALASQAAGPEDAPIIALHREDEFLYKQLKIQGAFWNIGEFDEPLPIDHYFEDKEVIQVGDLKFTVIHTPGHSPGGVCLRVGNTVYTGDTLFQGSIGRTDFWGGDMPLLLKSIRTRLLTLPDDTRVCSGHGPDTTIGEEKRSNPFVQERG